VSKLSTIEWTDSSWNPVTGCTKVSLGCRNCYAERFARRLKSMGQPRYRNGFKVTLQRDLLQVPLKWSSPSMVFVNSMSDLFHEDVPVGFIEEVVDVIRRADWHIFQVLTKRADRLAALSQWLKWPDNLWLGVSVESGAYCQRIATLRTVPAAVRFVSFEPLLGPIGALDLSDIHWVIVGGESGPGARPIRKEWVTAIRDCCTAARVPFFFKQWGGQSKKEAGRLLDGHIWNELPPPQPKQRGDLPLLQARALPR
jgi:protein gp37